MPETKTLHDALVDELRDLYHAEKQLVRALPKMARAAGRDELRDAIENHLAETEHQLTLLEQAFEHLDERPVATPCAGMAGILAEGLELLKDDLPEAVMDSQIIAAAQRVEHYEMAAYGTVAAWADQLGRLDVAHLLREILEEEKDADSRLTSLAEAGLNAVAAAKRRDAGAVELAPVRIRGRGRVATGRGRLPRASGGTAIGRARTIKPSSQRGR